MSTSTAVTSTCSALDPSSAPHWNPARSGRAETSPRRSSSATTARWIASASLIATSRSALVAAETSPSIRFDFGAADSVAFDASASCVDAASLPAAPETPTGAGLTLLLNHSFTRSTSPRYCSGTSCSARSNAALNRP